jgi:hypothetical protein
MEGSKFIKSTGLYIGRKLAGKNARKDFFSFFTTKGFYHLPAPASISTDRRFLPVTYS